MEHAEGVVVERSAEPVDYVWVEVHEISLYEETSTPQHGGFICIYWPVTDDLHAKTENAKATHGCTSAMLMRKSDWEKMKDAP